MSETLEIFNINVKDTCRIDVALARNIDFLSREKCKALIKSGAVKCNGILITDPSFSVKSTDDIVFCYKNSTKTAAAEAKGEIAVHDAKVDIVWQDEHIAVLNKPAGMTVHSGCGTYNDTLVNVLVGMFGAKNLSDVNGNERLGIVHRLDRETSGLIIIAKNNAAHLKLMEMFKNRSIDKFYFALCVKTPMVKVGYINSDIARCNKDRTKMAAIKHSSALSSSAQKARSAITWYSTQEVYQNKSCLLLVKIFTGRTHQIRVHLSSIGCPIYGDKTYNQSVIKNKELALYIGRQALHSHKLKFIHPITLQPVECVSEMPNDMTCLAEKLRQCCKFTLKS